MTDKKKIKKRYKDYPPNVPRKLFRYLKNCNFNRSIVAFALGVNSGHLSKLLNDGIEPKDNDIRRKLFLKIIRPIRSKITHQHKEIPEFIKKWRHLPTEEREKVIQQYLDWKEKK